MGVIGCGMNILWAKGGPAHLVLNGFANPELIKYVFYFNNIGRVSLLLTLNARWAFSRSDNYQTSISVYITIRHGKRTVLILIPSIEDLLSVRLD